MRIRLALCFGLLAGLLSAQSQPPNKVNDWAELYRLLSGVDIKVRDIRNKSRNFKFGEAREDAIIVLTDKEQTAIPREEVDRVEVILPKGAPAIIPQAQTSVQRTPAGQQTRVTTGGARIQSRETYTIVVYQRLIEKAPDKRR